MFNKDSMRKVSIIGSGCVGATIAYALSIKGIADEIVLVDKDNDRAKGEADDIRHGIPYVDTASIICGDYFSCRNSSLTIIAAGRNRKPGETRMDLADDNIKTIRDVLKELKKYYTSGPILMVTNPVDILTTLATQEMDLPEGTVFGTGCLLDSSRLLRLTADYIGLKPTSINGFVAGQHGDHQTVAWSKITVEGMPIEDYCRTTQKTWNDDIKNQLQEKALGMGTEIIAKKGSTHYGIATCVCMIADAVLNNRATVACVSSVLKGMYGVSGIAMSIPSVIDATGIRCQLEEHLNGQEMAHFKNSGIVLKKKYRMTMNGGC